MAKDHLKPTLLGPWHPSPARAMLVPGAFIAALALTSLVVGLGGTAGKSILGAAVALLFWLVALLRMTAAQDRVLSLKVLIRKPHWVQALTQMAIYGYWGWHVASIRVFWILVVAQIFFAYALHALLTWSRRDAFELSFGPLPIILSINLFLLFRPEWFFWQFGIITLGFLAKEFIRWDKDGRSAHIFNPSSFPLAVFSLALILTGTTETTMGVEIASVLFNPPHMYAVLFLVSLPVQLLFGVATMTIAAVVTTYAFGLVFFWTTGTYLFFDAFIPIAVFLGMHLLITDPSTSPRTEAGRLAFGILYGCLTMLMFGILRTADVPVFFDKLLPIPILNLTVQLLDRAAARGRLRFIDFGAFGRSLSAPRRRAAVVGLWATIFVGISLAGGLGDDHPGQWVPFWEEACASGSVRGCEHYTVLQQNQCLLGSGWSCNELAIHLAVQEDDLVEATGATRRGCELGFPAACANARRLANSELDLQSARPGPADLPIVLRGSKGPVTERNVDVLYEMACERGFAGTCPTAAAGSAE